MAVFTPLVIAVLACASPAPAEPAAAPVPVAPRTPTAPGEPTVAQAPLPVVSLLVDGKVVVAEVADDPQERAAGLMFRESLAGGQGMLFVYPSARPRSFWMKNTLLPLSIAYIDEQGRIVSTHDMVPLSERPVRSRGAAQFALEVPVGWFTENGVEAGDLIEGLPGPSRK